MKIRKKFVMFSLTALAFIALGVGTYNVVVMETASALAESDIPVGVVTNSNGEIIENGGYTNVAIQYTATDVFGKIDACYVRMPGENRYTEYAMGTTLTQEGVYYFYAENADLNASTVTMVTIDKTKPTGTIFVDGNSVESGTVVNASGVQFVGYDDVEIGELYVKKPNKNTYIHYTSGVTYTGEGEYIFYAVDLAKNVSMEYSVILNREIPWAQLYVDDKPLDNHSYTNGAHIRFECNAKECYVKTPEQDSFIKYISGTEFYKPGKYVFYGVSEAGVQTDYYSIVIDRTEKPLTVYNIEDGFTNGDVAFYWENGNENIYAPVVSVTINGKPYQKNALVYTIDTGRYDVVCTDAAGNIWTMCFVSTKRNVLTQTFQQEYYEAPDKTGKHYTFSSYENALAFSVAREKTFVRTGEWHNVSWDVGVPMDIKDSVNATNGTYYIYKKSGVPDEEVAYFTKSRLEEVIAEYAKETIKRYYYWEKTPAPIADGENLFGYSDSRTILANRIELSENIGCLIDGDEFDGKIYENEGKHVLTVYDEWGNTCDYHISVVRSVADIRYCVEGGERNLVVYDRTYRFKEPIKVFITDENDEFAMFSVYDENGELIGNYHLDDVVELTKSGGYTVVAINHYGVSETFSLIISVSPPGIVFEENETEKRLDVIITESADSGANVQTLEIYKSTNGGATWSLLDKDDYGAIISTNTLKYSFRTSAYYRVVVADEFRSGLDSIVMEAYYLQKRPLGTLYGVEDGGYTNGKVKFVWEDEAQVVLTKDNKILQYQSGQELTEDGTYVLIFENYDGYRKVYAFVIDTQRPELLMEGVKMQGKTQTNVTVYYTEDLSSAKIYKNGLEIGDYISGTEITDTGRYTVKIVDFASNTNEVSFEIDKLVDYTANVNDKGLANSVIISVAEEVNISVEKDGEAYKYQLDEEIAETGFYTVTMTDLLGNSSEFSFTIIHPVVQGFTHNFDDVPGFEMVIMDGTEKRLNYGTLELFEDGTYEVGVVVNGQTYTFTVTVDSTAPTLILNGVEDGGETKESVTITNISEVAEVKVYLNGKVLPYNHGDILKDAGDYKVVVTDECGNFTEYTFKIRMSASGSTIALIIIGCVAVIGGVVFFILKKKKIF